MDEFCERAIRDHRGRSAEFSAGDLVRPRGGHIGRMRLCHVSVHAFNSRIVEFRGLGGPFRNGLIAESGPDDSGQLRVVGRYDLDQSAEVVITGARAIVSQYDLAEASGL
jgi:hypothetical protein